MSESVTVSDDGSTVSDSVAHSAVSSVQLKRGKEVEERFLRLVNSRDVAAVGSLINQLPNQSVA